MNGSILEMMDIRGEYKNNKEKYEEHNNEFKIKSQEAKETWLRENVET